MPIAVEILRRTVPLIAIAALWIRRDTWRCRWEGAPTLIAASASLRASLTTPYASDKLSEPLHRLTGLWNVEDLIGHMAGIVCVSAMAYLVLAQFGNDQTLQFMFHSRVILPLTAAIPILVALFSVTGGHTRERNFDTIGDRIGPDLWTTAYWGVLFVTVIYLLGLSIFGLCILAAGGELTPSMSLYILAIGAAMLFYAVLVIHATTQAGLHNQAWALGHLTALCWAVAPIYSWRVKTRPLRQAKAARRNDEDLDPLNC